jgi:hypothetical protein
MHQAFSISFGGRPKAAYARLCIKNMDLKSAEGCIVEKGLGRDKARRSGAYDALARAAARMETRLMPSAASVHDAIRDRKAM